MITKKCKTKRMTLSDFNNRTEEEKEESLKRYIERRERREKKEAEMWKARLAAHFAQEKELENKND